MIQQRDSLLPPDPCMRPLQVVCAAEKLSCLPTCLKPVFVMIKSRSPYPPLVVLTVQPRPIISCTVLRPPHLKLALSAQTAPGRGGAVCVLLYSRPKLAIIHYSNLLWPCLVRKKQENAVCPHRRYHHTLGISGANHRVLFTFPRGFVGTIFTLSR
ncbi:hypothetical protein H4582DRAFT_108626 [Lactarius indigo]|nr:hypothetical protein H4582DRAFT_108626 [Lactarius indigo]